MADSLGNPGGDPMKGDFIDNTDPKADRGHPRFYADARKLEQYAVARVTQKMAS